MTADLVLQLIGGGGLVAGIAAMVNFMHTKRGTRSKGAKAAANVPSLGRQSMASTSRGEVARVNHQKDCRHAGRNAAPARHHCRNRATSPRGRQ